MPSKTCSLCESEKSLSEFHKDSSRPDGHAYRCKPCKNGQLREYRKSWSEEGVEIPDEKYCPSCERTLSKTDFHRNKQHYDGLSSYCAECNNAACRESYERNKDSRLQKCKEWQNANPEKVREYARRYRQRHPEVFVHHTAKRRAKKLDATPEWADLGAIEDLYHKAQWLTDVTGIQHVVDHIDPLQHDKVCGLHVKENLQILTYEDNARKSNNFYVGEGNTPLREGGSI